MTNPVHKSRSELKAAVTHKLKEIADALLSEVEDGYESIGLLDGYAGIMLFLFHYSRYSGEEIYSQRAVDLLYKSIQLINAGKTDLSYSLGLCGFAWTLEFLANKEFIEPIDMLHPLDVQLSTYMIRILKDGDWDPLHGGLGIGWYLFERREISEVKRALEHAVEILESLAVEEPNGLKWPGKLNDQNKIIYNLGLAHGIPGVMVFLSRCMHTKVHPVLAQKLMKQAVNYLLACNLPENPSPNLYPIMMEEEGPVFSDRLAWCYGDPGLSLALISANAHMGTLDTEIGKLAKTITSRKLLEKNKIFDACLCHGTAGMIPILQILQSNSPTKVCITDSTIDYWVGQSLIYSKHQDGLAGYLHHSVQNKQIYLTKKRGLLDGIAGIGMCLLSYLTGELDWTRALMMLS